MKNNDFMEINCHMKMLKKKDIPKGSICALFRKPSEQNTLSELAKWFPIHWCIHDDIRNNFWDRW